MASLQCSAGGVSMAASCFVSFHLHRHRPSITNQKCTKVRGGPGGQRRASFPPVGSQAIRLLAPNKAMLCEHPHTQISMRPDQARPVHPLHASLVAPRCLSPAGGGRSLLSQISHAPIEIPLPPPMNASHSIPLSSSLLPAPPNLTATSVRTA